MGIRIHKMMGYGLDDIKTDSSNKIIDERINPNGILGSCYEKSASYTVKGFCDFLIKKEHKDSFCIKKTLYDMNDLNDSETELQQYFCYDSEFGLPNVLCVVPPEYYKEWFRYDDAIDYAEEVSSNRKNNSSNINRFQIIPEGIFPWSDMYFDRVTGESFKFEDFILQVGYFNSNFTNQKELDRLSQILYNFKDWNDLKNRVRSKVPDSIQLLCEYCELFTDPIYIRDLRSLLYVYWG